MRGGKRNKERNNCLTFDKKDKCGKREPILISNLWNADDNFNRYSIIIQMTSLRLSYRNTFSLEVLLYMEFSKNDNKFF